MVKKSCYQQNDYTQLYTPASSSSLFPTRPTTTTTKLFLEDTHFPFHTGVLRHFLHILKDPFLKRIPNLHIYKFYLATQSTLPFNIEISWQSKTVFLVKEKFQTPVVIWEQVLLLKRSSGWGCGAGLTTIISLSREIKGIGRGDYGNLLL